MSREVRMVPKGWKHPQWKGRYIPLLGGSFEQDLAEWEEGAAQWEKGLVTDFDGGWEQKPEYVTNKTYKEWAGDRPNADDYMPDWPEIECTHYQMYETTSEGTPISPVMETPEELARWLADNGASAFADMTATYEQWLATIRRGSSVSAMWTPGTGLVSGVEYGA